MNLIEADKWMCDWADGMSSIMVCVWRTREEAREAWKEAQGEYPVRVMCIGNSRIRNGSI